MKVVLVHGFFDSGRVMENIAKRLTQDGHQCLTPSLKPNDGRDGLDVMACQLHEILQTEMDNSERFALVGFSMGALISRYYLQELNGNQRVNAFFRYLLLTIAVMVLQLLSRG